MNNLEHGLEFSYLMFVTCNVIYRFKLQSLALSFHVCSNLETAIARADCLQAVNRSVLLHMHYCFIFAWISSSVYVMAFTFSVWS